MDFNVLVGLVGLFLILVSLGLIGITEVAQEGGLLYGFILLLLGIMLLFSGLYLL